MAGDWLKFECSLPEKPETLAITAALGWTDPDTTVGKLMRLFRWFDQHTTDGNARGVTAPLLDSVIGVAGFASAVADVGWLVFDERGVTLQKFDRHNGASAKSRAQTAKRVANHRSGTNGNADRNVGCNAATVTEALAREEKSSSSLRSEEKAQRSRSAPPPLRPEDVTDETWADWLQLRKSKRAPVTETVLKQARTESIKAGMSLQRFLEIWCMRGSQGLQADWLRAEERKGNAQRQAAAVGVFGPSHVPGSRRGEVINA